MGASREPPPAPCLPVGSGPCSAPGSQQEAELRGAGLALPGRGPPSPPASLFPAATHGVCRRRRRRRRSGSSAAGRAAGSPATAGSSRSAVAAAAGALRSRRLHRPGRAGRRGQPPASRAPTAPRGRPAAAPPRPLCPRPRLERCAAPPAAASRPSPAPRCNFPRRQWAAARSQPCSFLPSPPPPTRTRAWAGEQRVTAGSRCPVPSAPPPPFSLATGRRLGSAAQSTARPTGVRASWRDGPARRRGLPTGRLLPPAPPAPAPSLRRGSPRGRPPPLPTSHLPLGSGCAELPPDPGGGYGAQCLVLTGPWHGPPKRSGVFAPRCLNGGRPGEISSGAFVCKRPTSSAARRHKDLG